MSRLIDGKEEKYRDFFIKLIIVVLIFLSILFMLSRLKKHTQNTNSSDEKTYYKNIELMKKAALNYYNEENIPKEIGEIEKITLEELIKQKKIKLLKDDSKKRCDTKKSFIKLTKKDNDYQLKLNLVCGDISDYIILHIDHFDHCKKTYLCTKKSDGTMKKAKEKMINDGFISNKKSSFAKKNNSKTSKEEVKASNKVETEKKNSKKEKDNDDKNKYVYEYKKQIDGTLSSWSSWSDRSVVDCSTSRIICNNNDKSCLKEVTTDKRTTGYVDIKYSIKRVGSKSVSVCSNGNYITISSEVYSVNNIDDYNSIYTINKSTGSNISSWKFNGRKTYKTPPKDTYNKHYFLVGDGNSSNARYIYDEYVYSAKITKVIDFGSCTKQNKQLYNYFHSASQIRTSDYSETCYKRERTRTLSDSKVETKWSTYNDKKLLSDGYKSTGEKKKK